eukprot:12354850-Alexandrium_andersonii.AAC.1
MYEQFHAECWELSWPLGPFEVQCGCVRTRASVRLPCPLRGRSYCALATRPTQAWTQNMACPIVGPRRF